MFCIGVGYVYQVFNNEGLGAAALILLCDGILVSLLLYWFCTIKVPTQKKQYLTLCIALVILIPGGLLFGTRFAKKQSVIAYFDLPYFISSSQYQRIILDDLDYKSLKKQSKDFLFIKKINLQLIMTFILVF